MAGGDAGTNRTSHGLTVEDEINARPMRAPHLFLLGAGASKAALPDGDRNGVEVPLLRDIAVSLGLDAMFPPDLRALAAEDFESAYSKLFDRAIPQVELINSKVRSYFEELQLPDEPTLYDVLLLSLRSKDIVCTFNWDPFLVQAMARLGQMGITNLPQLAFLHGNVKVGACDEHRLGTIGAFCGDCGKPFTPSQLLFPVEHKDYQDGGFIEREWKYIQGALRHCFMLTVFGYSAPSTDVEAVDLLKAGWGPSSDREMEQTEIINRPGSDHDELRATWDPFIHTHHYEIHDSFYDSWVAKHPRRSGEAYRNVYVYAQFISDNPVPRPQMDWTDLIVWFRELREAEERWTPSES